MFDMCKVPIEHEAFLMRWLDDQIDKTHVLGIANGDPPGTGDLTPEFFKLARTGLLCYLGTEIADIASAVSKKCTVCNGRCAECVKSVCATVLACYAM